MMGQQQQQQQGQPQQYPQQYAPQPAPQYAVHQAPPHQQFRLPKLIGYLLIMVAVIFIPIGMMISINASGVDAGDTVKMGMNIGQIGVLLASVFTMLFLGMGADLDKFEKLGLLLFLGILVSAATGFNFLGNLF
ncbi:MAG: hypothetical protein V1934_04880 [Methanobacteriota archaeon]